MDLTYLKKLETQLKEKELEDFWIWPHREDWAPIKETNPDKVLRSVKKKAQYYGGKKIANVMCIVDKKAAKEDGFVFRFKIVIFQIHEDGSVGTKQGDSWGFKVNYKLEDLETRKFKLKDLHKIIKLCADGVLDNDHFNGMSFKNFMKKLDRLNIDLDEE
jgi:hypothetical protein